MPEVQILLSTYNGEAFLEDQLESIVRQSHQNWKLLVRDDGSSDSTLEIVRSFAERVSQTVEVTPDSGRNLAPARSFGSLLEQVSTDYLMLCDQDDVWLPTKIERSLGALLESERRLGKRTPLLVHTDLEVVDEGLQQQAPSFVRRQVLAPSSSLNRLPVQNSVTGCTVIMNRALRDACHSVPDEAIMHDWWLALVAAALGLVIFIDEPTIRYRQHGRNSVGAKSLDTRAAIRQARNMEAMRSSLLKTQEQARAFLEAYRERLTGDQVAAVSAYAELDRKSFLSKRATVVRYGFWKSGLPRNLGLLYAV